MNNQLSSGTMSRSAFNSVISILVALASIVFFTVASFTDPATVAGMNSILLFVVLIVGLLGIMWLVHSVTNPAIKTALFLAIPALLGFTSSPWLSSTDSAIMYEAAGLTAMSAVVMMLLSAKFPDFFTRIQGILTGALIALIVVGIVGAFFMHIHMGIYHFISIVIFLGFLGYDFVLARTMEPTYDNAVVLALNFFIDLLNLFMDFAGEINFLDD
ncbi:Bax inhibitor-1 family protein [Vibrio crassostreae]|uniref:Bax inhibitor-1 family protein n=1 Tax=Vibrio crassostreae TaxID=246167 RepID=UPI001B304266|nr:Bax inhibitor-1 family protein [Vibrio crassostreae]